MTTRNRGNARPRDVYSILVSLKMKADNKGVKPWKPSPLGQHGFDPTSIALCLILKTVHNLTLDGLVDFLSESPRLVKSLGLKSVPARSTLQSAMARVEPEFVQWLLVAAGRPNMRGTLAGDSSGFSTSVHMQWMNTKYGDLSIREFLKLHIVTTRDGIIVAFLITDGRRGDAPVFEEMCVHLPKGSDHILLDAAYLSRNICERVTDMGRTPVIKPKKNTRIRGFDAMGKMLHWYADDNEGFMATYAQRNVVEWVFSSIKRKIADTLRSRKTVTQQIELAFVALYHNISILATR